MPGFRAARNRRLPRPEFREINRGIPIDQLRQSIVEERKVLRAMLQGAGVESRTCAPDPTLRIAKPWSTDFRHNEQLRPNSAESFHRRPAAPNPLFAERTAQAFAPPARAFEVSGNPQTPQQLPPQPTTTRVGSVRANP